MQGGDIYANHIAPLEGFHVAGVLWYQGCNDSTNEATALAYESQMTLLINQYREVFDQDDLRSCMCNWHAGLATSTRKTCDSRS